MQVVPRASLHPQCCFLCTGTRGPMIDTGVRGRLLNGQGLGALYICLDNCAAGILRALNAKTEAEYKALVTELIEVRETNEGLAAELQRARPVMREVARAAERVGA